MNTIGGDVLQAINKAIDLAEKNIRSSSCIEIKETSLLEQTSA
jgi:hypothetical protein